MSLSNLTINSTISNTLPPYQPNVGINLSINLAPGASLIVNAPIIEAQNVTAETQKRKKRKYEKIEKDHTSLMGKGEQLFQLKIIDRQDKNFSLTHFEKIPAFSKRNAKKEFEKCDPSLFAPGVMKRLKELFNKAGKSSACYCDDFLELNRVYQESTRSKKNLFNVDIVKKSLEFEQSTTLGARYTTQVTINNLKHLMELGGDKLKEVNLKVYQYFEEVIKIYSNSETKSIFMVVNLEHLEVLVNNIPSSSSRLYKNVKSNVTILIANFRKIQQSSTTSTSASNDVHLMTRNSLVASSITATSSAPELSALQNLAIIASNLVSSDKVTC